MKVFLNFKLQIFAQEIDEEAVVGDLAGHGRPVDGELDRS